MAGHGGTCNTAGVDIFTMHYKEYRKIVCIRREASLGNIFVTPFLQRIKIYQTPHSNSNYDASQEGYPGPPISCDVLGQKYLSSRRASTELISAVMWESKFSTVNHLLALREERRNRIKIRDGDNEAKLGGIVKNLKEPDHHLILRAKHMGSWLTI